MNGCFQQVLETCSDEETGPRCLALAAQLIMIDLTEPLAPDLRVFRELASEAATWALLVIASQSYVGFCKWINSPFDTPPESPAIQGELFDLDSILRSQTEQGGLFLKKHLPRPSDGQKSRLPCPTNDYFKQQC
jgi:hypothetical protein